jgi:hypothetical protein
MGAFIQWLKSIFKLSGANAFAIFMACSILLWIDLKNIFSLSQAKEFILIAGISSGCISITRFFQYN